MHHALIYDSTNPYNLPPDVDCIAYIGGQFEWSEDAIRRARAVYRLCELQSGAADYMDRARGVGVEPGAATVQEAIKACHNRGRHHDDFTVYTSLAQGNDRDHQPGMRGIIDALRSNAPGLPFRIHVAAWDGNPNDRPEMDGVKAWAKQYLGNVHSGAYDLSVLYGENDLVRH